jgi:hypothetical protein
MNIKPQNKSRATDKHIRNRKGFISFLKEDRVNP